MEQPIITCAYERCGNPIEQVPGLHRRRQYCSDRCRANAHRLRCQREAQAERAKQKAPLLAPFADFGSFLQRELEALKLRTPEHAERLAIAIRYEMTKQQAQVVELARQEGWDEGMRAAMNYLGEKCSTSGCPFLPESLRPRRVKPDKA